METAITEKFTQDCERLGLSRVTGRSIKKLYWRLVPYDWRPRQLWYRFKCWAWYRYTTIRPRTMPWHTWTDCMELLPHCMFEILGRFIERECSPGHVDWDNDDAHRHARKEMQELWDWWNNVYLKFDSDKFLEGVEQPKIVSTPVEGKPWSKMDFVCSSPEKEQEWRQAVETSRKAEVEMGEDLKRNCKRLIDIMDYLWT